MTIPGYIIDILQNKINNMHLHVSMFGEKLLIFFIALLLFSFGISLYTIAKIGVSPYDSVALVLEEKGFSYRIVRSTQDIIFVCVAFIFHGPIGLGTLLVALGTGFFVNVWRDIIKKIYFEKERKMQCL